MSISHRLPRICSIPPLFVALAAATPAGAVTVGDCIRSTAGQHVWLETTLWGLYDQEGGWVGAEIANRNGTHDLGPLQINSAWVLVVADRLRRDPADVRHWLRDDACFNVGVAAWLFLSIYRQTNDYWRAVGAYHSPTAWRQRQYANDVVLRLRRRFGAGIFQSRPPSPSLGQHPISNGRRGRAVDATRDTTRGREA